MNRRRNVELMVGMGLLLGPLAYALSLPAPGESPACEPRTELRLTRVDTIEICIESVTPAPLPDPQSALRPPPVPDEPSPESFLFVHQDRVVLSTEADIGWGTGGLRGKDRSGLTIASKHVDPDALPPELFARSQRAFDLYGEGGRVCTTRLTNLRVVSQWVGWDYGIAPDDDMPDYEETTPRQRWQAVWDNAEAWLVGDIEQVGDCDRALWARDWTMPAPELLHRDDRPTPETRAAVASFQRSDELAELRGGYIEWYGLLEAEERSYEKPWLEHAREYPARATTWRDSDDRVRFVELEFGDMGEGCGYGYDTRTTAVYAVNEAGELEITEHGFGAQAVVDLDLDGKFEFLYIDHGYEDAQALYSETEALDRYLDIDGDYGCPC